MPDRDDIDGDTGAPSPLLTVIVVSYNTREMTLACLQSLIDTAGGAADGLRPEILVLDNASDDGSAEAIAARWPQDGTTPALRLIALPRNIGFGAANNLGAAQARGRYLLLLNPDTVVLPGAVQALIAFAGRRPQARIWGGRTLFADGRLNPGSCFARQSLWSLSCIALGLHRLMPRSEVFNVEVYGAWQRDSEREVDIVSGCFLLIERSFWERLGGFDPRFFIYAEEADLCLRAIALGARPAITPQAQIIHHGGASQTVRADRLARLFAGKITLMDKHWHPASAGLGRWLYRVLVLVRIAGFRARIRLRGGAGGRAALAEWVSLWRMRAVWLRGWPALGDAAAGQGAASGLYGTGGEAGSHGPAARHKERP